jgi:dihydropteroate synthase
MIHKLLNTNSVKRLNGTTTCNTIALMNGAKILRVHDVKEAIQAIKIVNTTLANA